MHLEHSSSTSGANVSSNPSIFSLTLYMMLFFSGERRIKTGRIIPRDLQISFLVDLVAVAVNAIMFALVDRNALISPRRENSFLNCFPLHKNNGWLTCYIV